MFIPGEPANEPSLLNHMGIPVNALSGLSPSSGDFLSQWMGLWDSGWKKMPLILRIGVMNCVFTCM